MCILSASSGTRITALDLNRRPFAEQYDASGPKTFVLGQNVSFPKGTPEWRNTPNSLAFLRQASGVGFRITAEAGSCREKGLPKSGRTAAQLKSCRVTLAMCIYHSTPQTNDFQERNANDADSPTDATYRSRILQPGRQRRILPRSNDTTLSFKICREPRLRDTACGMLPRPGCLEII